MGIAIVLSVGNYFRKVYFFQPFTNCTRDVHVNIVFVLSYQNWK